MNTPIFKLLMYFCLLNLSSILTGQNLEIDTLVKSGHKDNRINFAFANVDHASANAYESKEELINDLEILLERFDPNSSLAKNGYSQYRNFFNVYSVWFNNPLVFEPIPSYYVKSQGIIDSLFLPWADDQHGWVTMMYTLKGGGGGGAGRRDDLRRGDALIWGLEWETILHEFNHTMTGVGDEYTASGEWSNFVCNESPNQTPALFIDEVPWRLWIEDGTPIPTPYTEEYFGKIGAFEGTIAGYFGCQRPTAQSCYMGAGGFGEGFGSDMCSVCLQRFICRLYQFVDAIEEKFPKENSLNIVPNETLTFSVNTVKPIPNTQTYNWFLNGKLIASDVETIDVTFGDCSEYELTFELNDTTDFVRFDEKFAYLYPEPKQTHTWFISNEDVQTYDLSATFTSINADCSGDENGKIIITATGGTAPYTFILNGASYEGDIEGLKPGTYMVSVVDAKGCNFEQDVVIGQDSPFDYELVSSFNNGVWHIFPKFNTAVDTTSLVFNWSNGSQNYEIYVTEKGQYSLDINAGPTCTNSKTIELLKTPCSTLMVKHNVKNPGLNANGAIYLDISNGIPPYEIKWFKSETLDLTTNNPDASFSSGNDQNPIHITAFLFDDVIEYNIDFWAENFTGSNYAGYNFGQMTTVDFYSLTSNVDVPERDAKDWQFQGSNDMNNWETLDERSDIDFPDRLEKQLFYLDQEAHYQYYRILITANNGDGWIAIQEMEIGRISLNTEIKESRNKPSLTNLSEGPYGYQVIDENGNQQSDIVELSTTSTIINTSVSVIQDGPLAVAIENPQSGLDYYWFADAKTQNLLHVGKAFQPPYEGNYYVMPVDLGSNTFTQKAKGFAVTMNEAPEISSNENEFTIVNPDPNATYIWYNSADSDQPIHTGISFTASEQGDYYVSTRLIITEATLINPNAIDAITLWADASDIDGDYQQDTDLDNSSAYKWKFKVNGNWEPNGWHAYRSNYSNGLGVVELGTVWFQYVQNETANMRSFIIVYEENGFSREGSAPFYGLKPYMGRHETQNQLFTGNLSDAAKNGIVHLNGKSIDPSNTFNTYKMKTLSVVLDKNVSLDLYATDEYWEGKIGELILFNRELSQDEILGLHAYLNKKWLSLANLDSPRVKVSWQKKEVSYDSTEFISICDGSSYLGLTEPGTYVRQMKTALGFDSIVTTVLSFYPSPEIIFENNLLSTNLSATFYQWYFEGNAIAGANNMEYTPTESGDYSLVIIDQNGCNSWSNIINVIINNIPFESDFNIEIFPNPTNEYITFNITNEKVYQYTMSNTSGFVIKKGQLKSKVTVLDVADIESGVYIITFHLGNKSLVRKIIKL